MGPEVRQVSYFDEFSAPNRYEAGMVNGSEGARWFKLVEIARLV